MSRIDVVLGLQYGDEGKGKITNQLAKSNPYDFVLRYNGGGNAGHTIFVNGKQIVTHLVPCGVFHGIPSVIGSGCVINVEKLLSEFDYLEKMGFDTSLVKIAYNAHIVTDEHISEDSLDTTIGTTKTGNGPCYRDKVLRVGKRAQDVPELKSRLIDFSNNGDNFYILSEGAQGYGLDIDFGDYPYVTSSSCGIGAVINNGFSHKDINHVVGVAKAYSTYVGAKNYQKYNDPRFEQIREIGKEYGATTGRPRQIQWMDLHEIITACLRNGVDRLIVNKLDVLDKIENGWNIVSPHSNNEEIIQFSNKNDFMSFVSNEVHKVLPHITIDFQETPF